jgi:hypothetical protein
MVLQAGFKKKLRLYVELKIYDKNRRKITGPQCVKNEKMLFIKTGIESVEEDQKHNNTRETYSDVGFLIYTNSCGDCVILIA